jgi:hypothetical protein
VDQPDPVHPQFPSTRLSHHIPLSPAAVRSLVDAQVRQGVPYGSADEQIIAEDTLNGHLLQVSLRQDTGSWTLAVRATPPLDAIISLHADRYSRHAAFSTSGEAEFSEIPEAWLRTKIDLVVVLPAAASP